VVDEHVVNGRLTSILASPRPASSRQAMAAHDERRICRCILEILRGTGERKL